MSHIIKPFITYFEFLRKKNGLKYAIVYYKAVKLHITRYICGRPLMSNTCGVSLTRDGFPSKFLYLKNLIDSKNVRVVLSLLTYTRTVKPNKWEAKKIKPDFSTISNSYTGKVWTIPSKYIKLFVEKNGLSLPVPEYEDKNHYISMKGSPNGPASLSSILGVLSLNLNQINWILGMINKEYHNSIYKILFLAYSFIGTFLIEKFNLKIEKSKYSGKLAIIKDPELKMRVIAMVDYLSQFTLKPIHDGILYLLKNKLPQDRTYTQDPFNNWSDNGELFHSLDLSAATDRFPVILQKKLLLYIYKDSYFVNNWMNLLTKREFFSSDLKNTISYSVGQPMGSYSSWAAFTITHHLVVHYAAFLAGINEFNDYIILGDDIVIKHNKVANNYIKIMTKLGVGISLNKTHVSKNTYEFAKRWISDGCEITGLPLKGILSNWKFPSIVYMELFNYFRKVPINFKSILDSTCYLYKGLKFGRRQKSFKSLFRDLYIYNHAIRSTFNLVTYDELRSFLCTKLKDNFMVPTEQIAPSFIRGMLEVGYGLEFNRSYERISNNSIKFNMIIASILDNWAIPHFLNELELKEFVMSHPLILAFHAKIERSKEILSIFDKNIKFFQTDGLLMKLQFEDLDDLTVLHKQKFKLIVKTSKLWTKPFPIIMDPDYISFRAQYPDDMFVYQSTYHNYMLSQIDGYM